MESLTKNRQSEETLRKMVERFFHPHELQSYKEMTEGYFNVAYEVTLSSGEAVILKVAPAPNVRLMSHERNIMYAEVQAMKKVREHGGIPVPEVLGYDNSNTICRSPYFFMEKLDGSSLNEMKDSLTREQIQGIYRETGKMCRKINSMICPCFGYPGQPEYQGTDWYQVFRRMLEAGIDDARQGNVDLQIPVDELLNCLTQDRDIFAEVTEPRLVHWDLWDGNVFVSDGKITGLIDWERCIWGDPLLEVGFRCHAENEFFRSGYGVARFTESEQRRILWYDIYLFVLASLECEYRKYDEKLIVEGGQNHFNQAYLDEFHQASEPKKNNIVIFNFEAEDLKAEV